MRDSPDVPALGSRGALRSLVALATLIAALPLAASAQPGPANALVNPDLDQQEQTNGWRIYWGAALDWEGTDSTGCPGSGIGKVTSAPFDTGAEWAQATQCVPYDFLLFPAGIHAAFAYQSGAATLAYVVLSYYSDTQCGFDGGTYLGFDSASGETGDVWHHVGISRNAPAPGTASIDVAIGGDAGAGTPVELRFDRAWFGPAPLLFADDFEPVPSTCRWSAATP
jgi:hypothetical protein